MDELTSCRPGASWSRPAQQGSFRRAALLLPLLLGLLLGLVGCGGSAKLKGTGRVLVRMTEWQLAWFEKQVASFAKDRGIQLHVDSYQALGDVESALLADQQRGETPILVKVEERMVPVLREAGLIRSLESVIDSGDLRKDLAEYLPEAMEPLVHGGKTWGIPRKVECMILLYRKSAIREATFAAGLDQKDFLAEAARFGLKIPEDHQLAYSPSDWDWVDLLQVAHFLSRVPSQGDVAPRFWHRTSPREGVPMDLACMVYPFGFRAGLLEQMPGFTRFLELEKFAYGAGIYPPLRKDSLIYTPEINQAWSRDEMDMVMVQQVDATRIVGASPSEDRHLENRSDAGFAVIPRAGILGDAEAPPLSPSGSWVWCLPSGGPAPELGYALARFLTSRETHQEECRRFGMMPIRKDLVEDLEATFPDRVMRDLMEVSFAAWENRAPKPLLEKGQDVTRGYELWRETVEAAQP